MDGYWNIAMKSPHFWEDPTAMYLSLILDEDNKDDWVEDTIDCDCFDNTMDANYEKVDAVNVAKLQTHLTLSQQTIL